MNKKVLFGLLFSMVAHADGAPDIIKVISVRGVSLPVEITEGKVKMSQADYSQPLVKVLVPALAGVTILDHRNTGEGAPCLATYETRSVDSVIQGNPETKQIPFVITLKRKLVIDSATQTCEVFLMEEIKGKIRGYNFIHGRIFQVGQRRIEDCN